MVFTNPFQTYLPQSRRYLTSLLSTKIHSSSYPYSSRSSLASPETLTSRLLLLILIPSMAQLHYVRMCYHVT